MRFNKLFLAPLFFMIIIAASCNKGGTGGDNTIVAFPRHHGMTIPNATVYIKYGTNSFPGEDVGEYDDNVVSQSEPGEDAHAHFEGLKKGKYFLYAVGYDSSISQIVKGGVPLELKSKAGETDVEVPVTED